jgi:hypothetical protein
MRPYFCFALLGILSSVSGSLWAEKPGELTGVHKTLSRCSSKDGAAGGPAYMAPCYEGFAYELGMQYSLVQNGSNVCGTFSACGGWNCSKVYAGSVVGKIKSGKVTLYSSNGHQQDGEAEVEIFRISPTGELLDLDSGKRAYTKTSPGLIADKEKGRCQPQFSEPVLLKDYELDIKGNYPKMANFEAAEKPVFQPPKPYEVKLHAKQSQVRIKDGSRTAGNLVPRTIRIHNPTDQQWELSTENSTESAKADEACPMWLQNSEKNSRDYVWAYATGYPPEIVPPKSMRYTRICTGDVLSLEKVLPECPKFQCLRTCRC